MSNSERLKEIKSTKYTIINMTRTDALGDLDWLVKRVDDLEDEIWRDPRQAVLESMYEENEWLKKRVVKLNEFTKELNRQGFDLKQQNKSHREALKFYANEDAYEPFKDWHGNMSADVMDDGGEEARKALKEHE